MFGDPMIGPGRELEVTNFALLIGAALNERTDNRIRGDEILVVGLHICIALFKSQQGEFVLIFLNILGE